MAENANNVSSKKDNSRDDSKEGFSNENSFDTSVFVVDFSKGLKKFWYIVLLFTVISGLLGGFFKYKRYIPQYESSVSFSVSTVTFGTNGTSVYSSYYDNSSAAQLSKTFPYIANTALMKNALLNELNAKSINGTITAEAVAENSNIFKVTVMSSSPDDAFSIVNAVIKVYPDVASYVMGNIKLNVLIPPRTPAEPSNQSNVLRIAAISAFVGAALGFGVIALIALFKNTLRKKEDIKNKLNQRCLVEIPRVVVHRKSGKKTEADKVVRITGKHQIFKESFRLLRKRLLHTLNENEKVIAVTSPSLGEGKTITALNLAQSLAMAGMRTALVDMDFKKTKMEKYLIPEIEGNKRNKKKKKSSKKRKGEIKSEENNNELKGEQFINDISENSEKKIKRRKVIYFTDVIDSMSDDFSKSAYKEDDKFYVFFPRDGYKISGRRQFNGFFRYLRGNFDYIIVNASCCSFVSDAVYASNLCDAIIITARQDYTSIDKIMRALEYLSYSTAKIKGFVFNFVEEGFSGYGTSYSYGKYGYNRYGYGKYGYGKYGYGRYGYGRYGYGRYGYGEYGYGDTVKENDHTRARLFGKNLSRRAKNEETDDDEIPDSEIPDKNM